MNSITPLQTHIPTRANSPKLDGSNDPVRQAAVALVENKQQKQLAETYLKTTVKQNNDTKFSNSNIEKLQELAYLSRSSKVVHVIDANDGEKLKSLAIQRQEKIEHLFQEIQKNDNLILGGQVNRMA